jgi:hypothetical protein
LRQEPQLPEECPRATGLPLLGELALTEPDLVKLVTFLNQTLKEHGFVFGLSRGAQGFRLAIYRAEYGSGPPGAS